MSDPVVIHLPFPPSINALWRRVGARIIKSEQYREWIKKADAFLVYTGGHKQRISGHFRYRVILDATERKRARDGDNYSSKAILDLLQAREVIENDKFADAGSWEWGEAPHGCRIELRVVVSKLPTTDEIEQAKTPRGGWIRAQLAEWGVPWPPPKGWRERLGAIAGHAATDPPAIKKSGAMDGMQSKRRGV